MIDKTKIIKIDTILFLCIVINLLIQKEGIKVRGIPLTIGSILVLLLLTLEIVKWLFTRKIVLCKSKSEVYNILYWFIILSIGMLLKKDNSTDSLQDILIYFISLVGFAPVYFLIQNKIHYKEQIEYIVDIAQILLLLLMFYSIFQYIFGIKETTIPGITVNLSDYLDAPDAWWRKKANHVGIESSKIMSTYQNGNLFGSNLLMFFPIIFEKKRTNNLTKFLLFVLFIFTIFISGSRTVIFGMVFYVLILVFQTFEKSKIKKETFFYIFFLAIILISGIIYFISTNNAYLYRLSQIMNWNSFVSATGRTENFILYIKWLFSQGNIINFLFGSVTEAFSGNAYEMLYGSLFIRGGGYRFMPFHSTYPTKN